MSLSMKKLHELAIDYLHERQATTCNDETCYKEMKILLRFLDFVWENKEREIDITE